MGHWDMQRSMASKSHYWYVFSSKHSNGTLGHAKNYWFKVTLLVKTKVKGKTTCTPPSSDRVWVHNVRWAGVTSASVSAQDITQRGVAKKHEMAEVTIYMFSKQMRRGKNLFRWSWQQNCWSQSSAGQGSRRQAEKVHKEQQLIFIAYCRK